MKQNIFLTVSCVIFFLLTACGNTPVSPDVPSNGKTSSSAPESGVTTASTLLQPQETTRSKTLVVYFSCTGTTETIANYAAEITNGDLYKIVPQEPYTQEDLAYYSNGRADQEQNNPAARPAISGSVENMEQYDTILLGYPIWHGQAPRIISTFLESYDFSGKTIIPFCTSHSSGIGSSASNLHAHCADSTQWRDGKRFGSATSKAEIEQWLKEISIVQ